MANDPYTAVYKKIWAIAEGHAALASRVKAGNRIKFDEDRGAEKLKVEPSTGDLPELMLEPVGQVEERSTSTARIIHQSFQFVLATGTTRVDADAGLFRITWELQRAFEQYGKNHGGKLGLAYVGSMTWKVGGQAIGSPDDRGRRGWATLMTVNVELHLSVADHLMASAPTF